jgi:iron complex transport system substrate-binding protein
MQILRTKGLLPGFQVIDFDQILPDVVDLGEYWVEANHRVAYHVRPYWQIAYVVEGTARIGGTGVQEIRLNSGSIVCVSPNLNLWADYGYEQKHHILWLGFHLSSVERRHPQWKLSQVFNRIHSAHGLMHLEGYFLQVIYEATTPAIHQAEGLQAALDLLLLQVVRGIMEVKKTPSLVAGHPAISKALGILNTRFRETWTLDRLAREVCLSQSRLAELFNGEVGYPVHRFLNKVRVRHAERLLTHSDLPIGDIALECGFPNIQQFSRVFKKVNGQVPIKFRRR